MAKTDLRHIASIAATYINVQRLPPQKREDAPEMIQPRGNMFGWVPRTPSLSRLS